MAFPLDEELKNNCSLCYINMQTFGRVLFKILVFLFNVEKIKDYSM